MLKFFLNLLILHIDKNLLYYLRLSKYNGKILPSPTAMILPNAIIEILVENEFDDLTVNLCTYAVKKIRYLTMEYQIFEL